MHQDHWIIGKKGSIRIRATLDEIDQEIRANVGTVTSFGQFQQLPVLLERRIPESRPGSAGHIPQAVRIESGLLRRRPLVFHEQLPLSGDRSRVAMRFEVIGEGRFALRINAEVVVVEYVRLARH